MTELTERLAAIQARVESAATFQEQGDVTILRGFSIPGLSEVIREDIPWLIGQVERRAAAVQAVVVLAAQWGHYTDTFEDEHFCACHGCQVRQALAAALEVQG